MSSPSSGRQTLPPFAIDDRLQLFFDDHLIHYVQNLTRRLHRPTKLPGPIIKTDQPWEHLLYFTCNTWNVIYDPQDKKFKCWYEDWDWSAWRDRKFQDTCMMLAVSADGIHWEKPPLGIRKIDGRDTNVVLGRDDYGSIHAATVFLDHLERDPNKRFKVIYKRHRENVNRVDRKFGSEIITFDLAASADGIHWTPIPENPITPDTLFGDVLIANRDPVTQRIVLMGRPQNCGTWSGAHPDDVSFFPPYDPSEPFGFLNKRNVWRTDSEDGVHWTPAAPALRQDCLDNLDDGFYGLNHFRVGALYVGILNILHAVDDTMDIELVYSRDDGRTWLRPFGNVPYIPHGEEGAWDHLMVTSCSAPVNVGKETFVYHAGARNHHDWWMYTDMGPDVPEKGNLDLVAYGLGLATLRRDGYVSLDAGVLDGALATKPFRREGRRLVINAACEKDGCVSVEVQDIYGRPWPGFRNEDCDVFTGDDTEHTVTWRGNDDLTPAGRYLKLLMKMKRASLYSLCLK